MARPVVALWTALVLAQGPVIAMLIILGFGRQAAAPIAATGGTATARAVAATTFALALAAVWLGGSLAAWGSLGRRSSAPAPRAGSLAARLLASPRARPVILAGLCVAECAVLLTIVHWGSGLRGPWPAMLGLLVLASGVGLLFGRVVFALSRSPVPALAVLLAGFLLMIALGGWTWPLTAPSAAIRLASAAMPSRWAFEGLLLIETDQRLRHQTPEASEPDGDRDHDLAAEFFPAETERMGARADAMTLGFMLIGLTAAAAFIAANARPSR
jgi:hypothetical protein